MEICKIGLWKIGTLEKWYFGEMEIRRYEHGENRKLNTRKNGIWGKWILRKLEICKKYNFEKMDFHIGNLEK